MSGGVRLADSPAPEVDGARPGPRAEGLRVRVEIVNPWFYPVLVGPGERFRRYAPGLDRRGIRLSVVTVRGEGLSDFEEVSGIPVTRIASAAGSRFREKTLAYRTLGRLMGRDRPDVVQVFSANPWNVPVVWLLRALGTPSVLVATMVAEGAGTGRWGVLRKWFRRWVHSGYARIVTSSGVMTRIMRSEAGGSPDRVVTIPNGVDLERFQSVDEEEKARLRDALDIGEGPAVLFVGGIYPRKHPHTLLEAWKAVAQRHPHAQLIMVGPRPNEEKYREFHDTVDRLAAAAPYPTRIRFTGGVGNVDDYMKACDLFVFPSEREGMPNVVPEAMAAQMPVILTDFKGLPAEFGRDGEEFRLVPRTPEGLAEAVCELLEDEEKGEALARRARAWVEGQLDVEVSLDAYARLYAELAHS